MCTTCRHASASLQDRLGNPSQTCFQAKQVTRSRRVSRADLPPSVLWRNRQTKACLVLRPKSRNRHGDFEVQITKPELPVLRPKPGETVATSFEAKLKKIVTTGFEAKSAKTIAAGFGAKQPEAIAAGFEAKPLETVATDFEVKPAKTIRVVLRPKHSQTVDLGFEAQPRNSCS
jgi:hypothetical protein